MTHRLSKSILLSFCQCPKRLWLEVHRKDLELRENSAEIRFAIGQKVGKIAQRIYGDGLLVNNVGDLDFALAQTKKHLRAGSDKPIYEATFRHKGVLVKADVLKPSTSGLHLVEVKSSTSVKTPYYPDCAIQSWVIQGAGYAVTSVALAHINNKFVYEGDGDYAELLVEKDLTVDSETLSRAVPDWVNEAQETLNGAMPEVDIGSHCSDPYDCPFIHHCWPKPAEFPLSALPRVGKLAAELETEGYHDLREVPPGRLTKANHIRVQRVNPPAFPGDSKP